MDPNQWTQKVQEVVSAAQQRALELRHAELTPIHVIAAMLGDKTGLAWQVSEKAAGPGAAQGFQRVVERDLEKSYPRVSPPPEQVDIHTPEKRITCIYVYETHKMVRLR